MQGVKLGPYVIDGELASGGMATIFVATHQKLGHVVAVKILHPHFQKDQQLVARFMEEARIQANLRHPNILTVHDILELPEASGMVMELLDGCSLSTYYRAAGTPMPIPKALWLFGLLAKALRHAHRDGVVHRDLKPSNVFLHRVHDLVVPKLMDFGVAKFQSGNLANRLTATGTVLGTPHYMAPEQFEDSSSVDVRADLFSFGVMFYEATTGVLPFEGQSVTTLMREILTHTPTRPSDLVKGYPLAVEAVLMRCLHKRREARYRNAAGVEEALRMIELETGASPIAIEDVPRTELGNLGGELTSVGTLTDQELVSWENTETAQKLADDDGGTGGGTVVVPVEKPESDIDWASTHVSRVRATPPVPSSPATVPGYRITRKIYEGSKTVVFRAVSLDDPEFKVIIKVLGSEYPTPQDVARLKHEYSILNRLDIEGIPRVVGLERYRSGLALVLEDIGAEPLRERLDRCPFTVAEFLPLACKLATILTRLHARNIIHKDINPKNMVHTVPGDVVQVIDFGLAMQMVGRQEDVVITGGMEGTLPYMSPEQTGRMNRPVDYRTDFYSLGATFYEMLCGRPPFDTTDRAELVHCHLAVEPTHPCERNPEIPQVLSDLVMRLMAKNAEDRYQSARGLGADLERCEQAWVAGNDVPGFPLGEVDVSDRFSIPQKLYGRDNDVALLMDSFERVAQGYREMMLVSGSAGIGKTSLVQEVYKPITRRHGYYISGKFDQYKRDIPYGALIDAFQGLIKELLSEGDERLAQWGDEIRQAVGPNGQVIVDVIPEVELVVGQQAAVPQLPPAESLNRLNLVFHAFFGVFAQEDHPLVIFLDDLQWADNASLNLLQVLLTGAENQHLFVIGAYRDNEIDAAHPLRGTIEDITKAATTINRIDLQPLPLPHINQLVAETLNCTLQHAFPLAELLEQKTGGNPFFMGEFLKSLHARELIHFNVHTGEWLWDIHRIKGERITDNVVDLMADKIRRMNASSQQALKLAACIGSQFRLQTLALVSGKGPSEVISALQEAVTEGLILLLGDAYKYLELESSELADGMLDAVLLQAVNYRFAHDKVQQAAYSLIPEEARQTVHRQIGLLLNDTPTEKRSRRVFGIVNQLNEGRSLARTEEERQELAELNLMAARRAKSAAAYRTALNCVRIGIELLPDKAWTDLYDLALQLHREAAEVSYLCTEFPEMEDFVAVVLEKAASLEDQIPVYETKIQGDIARARKVEALKTGLEVLEKLKVKIPFSPGLLYVGWSLVKTRLALSRRSIPELVNLPPMTNPRVLTAMRIATRISSTAYVVDPNLFAALVLKEVELSARYGNAGVSPFGYALYGTILCGVLDDYKRGYHFGKMALELQDKLEESEHRPRTAFTAAATSQHYMESLRETFEPLLGAYKRALENGDLEFAGTNSGVYAYHLFFSGRNLVDIRTELTYYTEVLVQIKQDAYLGYMRLYLQAALNLMGEEQRPWTLDGAVTNLGDYLQFAVGASDGHGLFNAHLCEGIVRLFGEDFAGAVEHFDRAKEYQKAAAAMVPSLVYHFYDAIARCAHCDLVEAQARGKQLRRIRADLKILSKLSAHNPVVYEHKALLVQAELQRLKGRNIAAMELYDASIDKAQQNGFLQEQALANEVTGRFYLAIGKERIARTYLTDAYHRYAQWGAVAKVHLLEKRYPTILAVAIAAARSSRAQGTHTTTTRSSVADTTVAGGSQLDMTSVLKASQVLSAEINLERLLKRLMSIVMENAGAQRGCLFLETDGKYYAEAESVAGAGEATVMQHEPIRERNDLAQSVVNYVMRLRETVVLDDAGSSGNFARDEYILERGPKSLLCMPLVRQGRLDGMLYLENNLATGAFTPGRIEVINLLAAEIAISLSNARLYDNLQQNNRMHEVNVEERTRDLALANQELEHEKRKSDQLLLNVLPERVAEELKEHGEARPERFDNVTVFFSDFVAFTDRAAIMTPEALLHELNDMFTAFDGIVSGNQCERIKTIGDAYLFVCGMPDANVNHAQRVIESALQIRDYVARRNEGHGDPWLLRMGIHSGPVVGGVVGIHKYIYDVFGDTINTAARMESHSEPMKINVSDTTRSLATEHFSYLHREPVMVKGKGIMQMFFVEPPATGEST